MVARTFACVLLATLAVTASAAVASPRHAGAVLAGRASSTAARLAAAAAAHTKTQAACGTNGLVCTQVVVPLDRTGVVPGTISLHVEELPALGTARGTMFLVAGGPGQGSAHVYGLGDPIADNLYRFLFPGYNLVAYDDRGTGASGLIDCPPLQVAITADAQRTAAAACGASLGAAASFYSTADHAEDLETVRQALGVDKIGLFGVSYGTKLALAYALAHPDHVERLLLDSVLPPTLDDSYGSNVLRSMPTTLETLCSGGACDGTALASDLTALANAYAAKPLAGVVPFPGGKTRTERVDGLELLSVVLDADLNPGLAAALPGTLHAARAGNTQPLLRLALLHDQTSQETAQDLSFGLYAATVCRDGPFPWQPDAPIADRTSILQSAIAALPAGTFGPLGSWAADFGNAGFCVDWPGPTGGAALGAGPLPNVPMLAVSGGFDMRTPTAGAQSVVAQFPQGHLLVVPGVGHSTVTADFSGCAIDGVRSWMLGQAVPASCPRRPPLVQPVTALPPPGSTGTKGAASPTATYAAVKETVRDAQALWLMTSGLSGGRTTLPGVFGGRLVASPRTIKLAGYADERGVALTGTLSLVKIGPPAAFQGALTVAGPRAAAGVVGVVGASERGTLGGRTVGG